MDETYDVVVLGTGLTECVLSGLLSVTRKKVLHMDRNDYYGAASASLNLNQLYEVMRPGTAAVRTDLGASREYNVDLVPKFVMSAGVFVRILAYTNVTKYLDFLLVDGSYVYREGKIHKVPVTTSEALSSKLMGLGEKRRAAKFFQYVQEYDESQPETAKGHDLKGMPMSALFEAFGLEPETREFIGHSIALHTNDEYLSQPAYPTVAKIKLYHDSLERYGVSPYIYPIYGLGEMPQSFARLSAVYGGTYMLNKSIDEIVYDESGHVAGVRSGTETVKCKKVLGDPSYFANKVKKVGRIVRCICILNHPIALVKKEKLKALQIVVPQNQVKRKNDIFISWISGDFKVCPEKRSIAILSTMVETETPEKEFDCVMSLIDPVDEKFFNLVDVFEPLEDGTRDGVFISKSLDATSHFEYTASDIQSLFKRVTGEDVDWEKLPVSKEADGSSE